MDRRRLRLRWDARPRRPAELPAAPARRAGAAGFRINYRDRCLQVTITNDEARYELIHEGEPLTLRHEEELLTILEGSRSRAAGALRTQARSRVKCRAANRPAADPASGQRPVVMSIARIDASSGSLASSSWMILWTSRWS